jgi:hypothetical protein
MFPLPPNIPTARPGAPSPSIHLLFVMAGLDPAIHDFPSLSEARNEARGHDHVDGRVKPGHDD